MSTAEQSLVRRFYHVRESGRTSEYDFVCSVKQQVLQQKEIARLLAVSSNASLEDLARASPDTGLLNILEQEHHDIQQRSNPLRRKRYQRDHFVLMEGTGEEIALVEQCLIGRGYQFIDAKTCTPDKRLKQCLGNLQPVHSEEKVYVNPFTFVERALWRTLTSPFRALALTTLIGAAYLSIPSVSSHFSPIIKKERPAVVERRTENPVNQERREVIGATYSFSTKIEVLGMAQSYQHILTSYLNARYTNKVSYNVSISQIPAVYLGDRDKGTVHGYVTGSTNSIDEIKAFIKQSLSIEKDACTYQYKTPIAARDAQIEKGTVAPQEARK